jgi:hypothetical protein
LLHLHLALRDLLRRRAGHEAIADYRTPDCTGRRGSGSPGALPDLVSK